MKICAIICEYNPFHNGHLHQLRLARELSGADALLCIMSGNFVQRGEAAILEKHIRAKHAILAGADIVIELPTCFATANAELFAKGAVSILNAIPDVTTLCFGAENADKQAFEKAAKLLNNEPKAVSEKIKALTSEGVSYAKARTSAWCEYVSIDLLGSPNNILGLEYTKALQAVNSKIEILPIQRIGGGYLNALLEEPLPSASAIRAAICSNTKLKKTHLPEFVIADLPSALENSLDLLEKFAILQRESTDIASVCDCTEGLENAFKKVAIENLSFVEALTSARYTSSRIRRIALHNLLGISHSLIKACLNSPLYLRVLAVKKEALNLFSVLGNSELPTLIRAHDENALKETAKECFDVDVLAEQVYKLLYPATKANAHTIFI